eukprot:XP_017948639.1 PREDICTED: salivary glue protein Sgs-3-like [Xenopus tropicalis]
MGEDSHRIRSSASDEHDGKCLYLECNHNCETTTTTAPCTTTTRDVVKQGFYTIIHSPHIYINKDKQLNRKLLAGQRIRTSESDEHVGMCMNLDCNEKCETTTTTAPCTKTTTPTTTTTTTSTHTKCFCQHGGRQYRPGHRIRSSASDEHDGKCLYLECNHNCETTTTTAPCTTTTPTTTHTECFCHHGGKRYWRGQRIRTSESDEHVGMCMNLDCNDNCETTTTTAPCTKTTTRK